MNDNRTLLTFDVHGVFVIDALELSELVTGGAIPPVWANGSCPGNSGPQQGYEVSANGVCAGNEYCLVLGVNAVCSTGNGGCSLGLNGAC